MPRTFQYIVQVYKTGADGFSTTRYSSASEYYEIADTPDAGKSDNIYQLGDVQNDQYNASGPDATFVSHYIGKTQNGFVGQSTNGRYFLYSDVGYGYNTAISSFAADQPGNPATFTSVCFVSGTRISTARGEVAVDALAVGDIVFTTSGKRRVVRWLGHRALDCRGNPRGNRPIRIAAHAFAHKMPARDLYVSPGHAICVDACGEVLIPAGALINGTTIVQLEVNMVTYWHVELESHDVIFAEGLPCESYLDMGNRGFFTDNNAGLLSAFAGADRQAA